MSQIHVIWFKRDLRVQDHAPLRAAYQAAMANRSTILPLYIVEPDYWRLAMHSKRQYDFVCESLTSLRAALTALGAKLCIRVGEASAILANLHKTQGIAALHLHEEIGVKWVTARNQRVKSWCHRTGIAWRAHQPYGVFSDMSDRTGWSDRWLSLMQQPRCLPPDHLPAIDLGTDPLPAWNDFGHASPDCADRQMGGRPEGVSLLKSFLDHRGAPYRSEMSSPVTAYESCSRLSPHIAFGTLSVREVWQATQRALLRHKALGHRDFVASLNSFQARLQWQAHFIQKLLDEADIETRNLHAAYDGVRPSAGEDDPVFLAWKHGRTGFPFIDACMRALTATGWLNFRMRAMLISFASYQLWLHWKQTGDWLALLFTDFEPGIHFPQVQMQAGTTGTNTARIYNPVKQSLDQDPDGVFIRKWVPELADLPTTFLHEPWRAPTYTLLEAGITLGQTYPERIVDHIQSAQKARAQIYACRTGTAFKTRADAIQQRHGSKRAGIPFRGQASRRKERRSLPSRPHLHPNRRAGDQLSLDLG